MSRLNPLVSAIGGFLTGATSTGVWRVHAPKAEPPQYAAGSEMGEWQPSTDLSSGCALSAVGDGEAGTQIMGLSVSPVVAGQGVLIGQWRLADNRTAVLINNHNWVSIVMALAYIRTADRNDLPAGLEPLADDHRRAAIQPQPCNRARDSGAVARCAGTQQR